MNEDQAALDMIFWFMMFFAGVMIVYSIVKIFLLWTQKDLWRK